MPLPNKKTVAGVSFAALIGVVSYIFSHLLNPPAGMAPAIYFVGVLASIAGVIVARIVQTSLGGLGTALLALLAVVLSALSLTLYFIAGGMQPGPFAALSVFLCVIGLFAPFGFLVWLGGVKLPTFKDILP